MSANSQNTIREDALALPETPGVYQFFDEHGNIIYIGKAKNLRKRVSSYFTARQNEKYKLNVLVRRIVKINHIVVENESEALLLENNLIKEYKPRYNVLLKDDKTFPWICIKNERFPRVFLTRKINKDGSEYFGPYTSAYMVKTLLNLIRQIYNLRTCKFLLSEENIKNQKFKVCLEYHIGNCKGPCQNLQSEADYNETIFQIRELLKGNLQNVINYLKNLMAEFSSKYQYEQAENVKSKIELLEKFKSKSTVVNPKIKDLDVFSIIDDTKSAYVNYLKIVDGAIIKSHTVELVRRLQESTSDLLLFAITELRARFGSTSNNIIVSTPVHYEIPDSIIQVPQRGEKAKLIDLSLRNAKAFKHEKQRKSEEFVVRKAEKNVLIQLKEDLRLDEEPRHIECFDNSNIQGHNPVAACVVFYQGKPKKSEYRHFNVKSVQGANDFATMEEIVYRRYKRLIEEKKSLPRLIVIDGGKGQLSAAIKSLKRLGLEGKIPIIGIAKRLEEIYFPGDTVPLYLNKNSPSLKLIQHIRNEAHRFGINFHRLKRNKTSIKHSLETIHGVGEKTISVLMDYFHDAENIEKAELSELEKAVDIKRAKLIWNHYHEQELM